MGVGFWILGIGTTLSVEGEPGFQVSESREARLRIG